MSSAAVVTLVVAFLAGIASFASPCCLPLVPAYLGYIVGNANTADGGDEVASRKGGLRALPAALAFSAGFSIVFVTLWASIGAVGYLLPSYAWLLRQVGGAILVLMGLHVAGLISIRSLYREVRLPLGPFRPTADLRPRRDGASLAQAAFVGVVFAAGWTPCIGPILGGIIGLASASESVVAGTALLVVYAAGLAVPFVLVAVGATSVTGRLRVFRDHYRAVSAVTGTLLVAVGFLMITNMFVRLAAFAPALPGV